MQDGIALVVKFLSTHRIKVVHHERTFEMYAEFCPRSLITKEPAMELKRKPTTSTSKRTQTETILRTNSAFPFTGKGLQGAPAPGRIRPVNVTDPHEIEGLLARGWRRA